MTVLGKTVIDIEELVSRDSYGITDSGLLTSQTKQLICF